MFYFDTSILVPLFLEEDASEAVERLIVKLPAGSLAVSHWTGVEFSSLLGREVRTGGLSARGAEEAVAKYAVIVAESFLVFLPTREDFNTATQYMARHNLGLRAGDALHLAIAANREAETIFSLDKTLVKAGKQLGLPTSAGIDSEPTGRQP